MAMDKVKLLSPEEMRASRDQRYAELADPAHEARRHEELFLKGIGSTQDEFDWLVEHSAWIDLGFASVADWWTTRIRPVMVKLDVRPTPEMVDKVLAKVREAERALPPAQRRTQRELADLTLASDWKVRGRTDSRNRRSAAGSDLEKRGEGNGSPLVEAMRGEIEVVANKQAKDPAPPSTEDEADGGDPTALGDPSAAGTEATSTEGEADRSVPAVTPTEDHRDAIPGETDDAGPSSGTTDSATEQRPSSIPLPAEQVEEQAPAGVTAPAPPNPEELEERTDEQDDEVLPPLPHAGDPAALIAWFADRFDQVDPDVTGPLLPSDDLALIAASLDRIVFVVDRLTDWHERAQR
jgi:hypothetical protein